MQSPSTNHWQIKYIKKVISHYKERLLAGMQGWFNKQKLM